MIYVTAQPDNSYFFWQLEVQLYNFKRMGVDMNKVHHIFISQSPMSDEYKQYKSSHPEINIHFYPDTRESKGYIPSQAFNGIKQFLAEYPDLQKEQLFYHDADILFRELPDFNKFNSNDTWYLSDTNCYINADYIKTKGDGILEQMCAVVGITPEAVEAINEDSGGAQHIICGTTPEFWHKVEKDSEALYQYMEGAEDYWTSEYQKKTVEPKEDYTYIQKWTAGMWSLLWNGVLLGKKMKVVKPDLDFCFATDDIEIYREKPIFHNAGVCDSDKHRLFFKGDYINKSPFGVDFSYVDKNCASYIYVQEIQDYVKSKRLSLPCLCADKKRNRNNTLLLLGGVAAVIFIGYYLSTRKSKTA